MIYVKWKFPDAKSGFAFCGVVAGLMVLWFDIIWPYLERFLASETQFATSYPFLYDITHSLIALMGLPWSGGPPVVGLYFYTRHLERKMPEKVGVSEGMEAPDVPPRVLASISYKTVAWIFATVAAIIYIFLRFK